MNMQESHSLVDDDENTFVRTLDIFILGVKLTALLDAGASSTYCVSSKVNIPKTLKRREIGLTQCGLGANKSDIITNERAIVQMTLTSESNGVPCDVFLCDNSKYDVILGCRDY